MRSILKHYNILFVLPVYRFPSADETPSPQPPVPRPFHRLRRRHGPGLAQEAPQVATHTTRNLDTVEVTSNPLGGEAESLAHPVEVLYGEELDARKAGTLGETVASLPGVQTTWFGTGVGRPIIRGQEGPRVQVLSGGLGSMDASTVSADHATSVEPFLADQIEVLKGPATLLFGSGAIGGAVNVVDGRIADTLPDRPLSGRAELRANSVNDERTGMFRLDGVSGNWVIHVDGLVRNTGDYDIPGYAQVEHEEHATKTTTMTTMTMTMTTTSTRNRSVACWRTAR